MRAGRIYPVALPYVETPLLTAPLFLSSYRGQFQVILSETQGDRVMIDVSLFVVSLCTLTSSTDRTHPQRTSSQCK